MMDRLVLPHEHLGPPIVHVLYQPCIAFRLLYGPLWVMRLAAPATTLPNKTSHARTHFEIRLAVRLSITIQDKYRLVMPCVYDYELNLRTVKCVA